VVLGDGGAVVAGAHPIMRFLASKSRSPLSLLEDDWLEWDATTLGPLSLALAAAAQEKRIAFPLDPTGTVAASASAGEAKRAKVGEAWSAESALTLESARAAVGSLYDCLARIESALSGDKKGPLSSSKVVAAAVAHSVRAAFAAGVVSTDKFSAVRTWSEEVFSKDKALTGSLAHEEAIVALIKEAGSSLGVTGFNEEIINKVVKVFTFAIKRAFPALAESKDEVTAVVRPAGPDKRFKHDLQCDSAMGIFGMLKKSGELPEGLRSPRDVAQKIIDSLPPTPTVEHCEVAGSGFINIFMQDSFLEERINAMLTKGLLPPPRSPRHVAIDYSSPNIAKDMHVGHLRSTIIGDSISRILEYMGHRLSRINHVGDWGTQFGMLLAHLKDVYPDYATKVPDLEDLTKLYKEAKARFDDKEDPSFKERSYKEVVALQGGDPTNHMLWTKMVEASAAMFNDVYRRLGVHEGLTLCGESFYNDMIPSTIEELDSKGLLTKQDGALLMFTPIDAVPLIVRKSDGGYGYDSTDLAAIRYRIQELKADWLIYTIDSGQSLHLRLTFEAARMAGWSDPAKHRIDHMGFGIVCGEDKKRFRTRSGDTVRLVDLLDQAKALMEERLRTRREESLARLASGEARSSDVILEESEIPEVAESMGYGAVKYFDLKQNRLSDYVFNYETMLRADGDTAVYLQYQCARMQSILRNAAEAGGDVTTDFPVRVTHPAEHKLCMHLSMWQDTLADVEASLNPHLLCGWLYNLACIYSEFQRDCRVIGDAHFESRIMLVKASLMAMRRAMEVIGIPPVKRL
jgi:arginyl-tRNA synthetase